MNKTVKSAIQNSRRLKKVTGYTLLMMLFALSGWRGYRLYSSPEHPRGAVRSRTEIAQSALRIGTALRGSAQLLSEPALQTGKGNQGVGNTLNRNRWVVLCEADHSQMNMLFDDATGRLVCMITEASGGSSRRHAQLPVLSTADAAVSTAVQRLQALEVLPANAEIALRTKPHLARHHRAWETDWLVRTAKIRQPYTVKLMLDSATGQPTCLLDMQERG